MSTSRISQAQSGSNPCFPFAAVVGNDAARRAMMLLAVDPGLKGVLLSGPSGSGKSVLARSLTTLFTATADRASVPFVELPLNTTEDRLLGSIDIERTLEAGSKRASAGLLAEANGGVLLVDDINLLDEALAAHVAASLESGVLSVERDGLSESHMAQFLLVGAYNPQEGAVSELLRDRVGLFVDCPLNVDPEERAEISERAFAFQEDPMSFIEGFVEETLMLKRSIEEARQRIGRVCVPREAVRSIAVASLSLGVEGNRADIFATRAARANAALAGRDEIGEADLITAIQLVLLPRATILPTARELEEPASTRPDTLEGEREESSEPRSEALQNLVIQARDSLVPSDAMASPARSSRPSAPGKRTQGIRITGGRYVRSVERRTLDCIRVAIDATLRSAAPHQRYRREGRSSSTPRLKITADDLRYKKLKRRSGMLFIFLVDASGSMVLNRMAQAKGAATRLLADAYLHRDRVALIGFRGHDAQVLLAPTRSVEVAKHMVDALPAGGGTPLAAGLVKALEIARGARLQDRCEVMLLVFTDGRANVGLPRRDESGVAGRAERILDELRQIGTILQFDGINSVVLDTRSRFVGSGEGQALAELLGGRYLYLPRAGESVIYEAVTAAAEDVRL